MIIKVRILLTFLLLSCIGVLHARCTDNEALFAGHVPVTDNMWRTDSASWWGYFDGDYSSVICQGIGSSMAYPLTYSCAIKINRTNSEVLGKRIKALRFAFISMDSIKDVKIWLSSNLPLTADDADVFCQNADISTLGSLEEDNMVNEISFDNPYQFGASDIYLGYSFTVTSGSGPNAYPVMVSDTKTSDDAFYIDWGGGWNDYSGDEFGNLALMLLLDDDGIFVPGDVNYDVKVNIGDVSATVEQILYGNVNPFNKEMGDIDGNGKINVVDAASIADIILGSYEPVNDNAMFTSEDTLLIRKTDDFANISLLSDDVYKAFQMDVVVPETDIVESLSLSNEYSGTHSLRYSEISEGRYRVVVYSSSGEGVRGSVNDLVTINTSAKDIRLENIIFVTSGLVEKHPVYKYVTNTLNIEDVCTRSAEHDVYTVEGTKLKARADELPRGVYIIDGKKIIIR